MYILHVHLHVKPESIEAFRLACIENAHNSLKEPGVVRFDLIQQADDPTRFGLSEVYRNPEAAAQHKETAHYHKWVERVTDMLQEPRSRLVYHSVYPADLDW